MHIRNLLILLVIAAFLGCSADSNSIEINVKQGDSVVESEKEAYNFGEININASSPIVTFTINNPGDTALQLIGRPDMIQKQDDTSGSFEIDQSSVVSPIYTDSTTSFSITFVPKTSGLLTAKIIIPNDSDKSNPFTFTISGTGVAVPEINVKQSTDIASGSGSYDFGLFQVGETSTEITFTIENPGSTDLTLTDTPLIDKYGTDESMFVLNQSATQATIVPGGSTTFTIKFVPTSKGLKTATIKIESNDADENPYTFEIKGEGELFHSVGWIGGGTSGWQTASAPVSAKDYQSFNRPSGVCTDSAGNVYVADSANHRICKWDASGHSLGWIGGGSGGWKTSNAISFGSDDKYFSTPNDVFVDSEGFIYVADTNNNRICKWSSAGVAQGWIGCGKSGWQSGVGYAVGSDHDYFYEPEGVYVASNGDIYVADTCNYRISKWDKYGNAVGWLGDGSDGWKTSHATTLQSRDYQSFIYPSGVEIDSDGNIIVADRGNCRISKWSSAGVAIGWIGGGSNGWKTADAPPQVYDYQGFFSPSKISIDSQGFIYVADFGNNRIDKWDSAGNAIGWIGGGSGGWKTSIAPSKGTDYQSFYYPFAVEVCSGGEIFVADAYNHRISKWQN